MNRPQPNNEKANMNDDNGSITESNLSEHFGDSGFQIKRFGIVSEAPWADDQEMQETAERTLDDDWEDDSPFADYIRKFEERFYPEQTITPLAVKKLYTPASPIFTRKRQAEQPQAEQPNVGRSSFRGILMAAMRLQAEHIIIQPYGRLPELTHTITITSRGVVETLQPAHGELIGYLGSMPGARLRCHLDELMDGFLSEYEPSNSLAHDYIALHRAAEIKEFEIVIALNTQKQKALVELKPVDGKKPSASP